MFRQSEYCHVCYSEMKLKKNESLPAECPICGTDLQNPASETVRSSIECEYIKGTITRGEGELSLTNKRIFFIKGKVTAESLGGGITKETVEKRGLFGRNTVVETQNPLSTIAVTAIAAKVKSRGAGELSVNIPLEELAELEDAKRGLRKGVTVRTRGGEEYSFYSRNPQEIMDFLSPYVPYGKIGAT